MTLSPHKENVVIIDYGYGNLYSAENAFQHVSKTLQNSVNVSVTTHPEDVENADYIVLPGQGAFGSCMQGLKDQEGILDALKYTVLDKGRPFLGICVGMQLLASYGLEFGEHKGLDWIQGSVIPLNPSDTSLKIPHMGWNTLKRPTDNQLAVRHPVLESIDENSYFYFVHSFMVECKNNTDVLALTDYGLDVEAIIGRDNFIGVQFHPEKSHDSGLRLIHNFLSWRP